MMKEEFEKMLGTSVTAEQYRFIEEVYVFHPSITEKRDIVDIFKIGGMRIIYDMLDTARKAKKLEDEIAEARKDYERVKGKYEALKKGETYGDSSED